MVFRNCPRNRSRSSSASRTSSSSSSPAAARRAPLPPVPASPATTTTTHAFRVSAASPLPSPSLPSSSLSYTDARMIDMRMVTAARHAGRGIGQSKHLTGTTRQLTGSTDREAFRYWMFLSISEVAPEVPLDWYYRALRRKYRPCGISVLEPSILSRK